MAVTLHYKYAVRIGTQWVAVDDKGKYRLVGKEKDAETRWDIRGALGIGDRYLKAEWNVTMGEKPTFAIQKVHRPQRIHHAW